jgi:hypothetical protein
VKYAFFWNGFELSKLRKVNLLFRDTAEGGCSAEVLILAWTGDGNLSQRTTAFDNVDSVTFQKELMENQG